MSKIKIFLPSDDNYAPQVSTAIASICTNTSSEIEFYILDGGILPENKEKICSLKYEFKNFTIEFLKVNTEKYFKDFVCPEQFTISTYNRFVLSKLMPDAEKILYLDSDIIVNGDIKELFDISLDDYLMCAVPEDYKTDPVIIECYERLGLSAEHKYFNAGVMLLNNKKWVEAGIDKKLFETEKEYRDKIKWADQDVLNIMFDNNYKPLDEKYNWMTQKNADNPNALIRHFDTSIKPWHFNPETKTSLVYNIKDFWNYLKLTPYYDEMLEKVSDKHQQQELLIKLRVQKLKAMRLQNA